MSASDLKRLRELEEENRRLKQIHANLSLEHAVLKDIIEKKSILLSRFFALTFGVLLNPAIPPGAQPDIGQLLVRLWERNFPYQVW